MSEGYPDDFFCYGLPGATLPLGKWDPFGMQLVSEKVVRKYRESELKHGRLAMLASTGFIMQEISHPFNSKVGGMAITHMEQLRDLPLTDNFMYSKILMPLFSLLSVDGSQLNRIQFPLDYSLLIFLLASFEISALVNNWTRWRIDEYNHQFDHNIGIGNLKKVSAYFQPHKVFTLSTNI